MMLLARCGHLLAFAQEHRQSRQRALTLVPDSQGAFRGGSIPFGCAVRYLPNETKVQKQEGKSVFKDKQAKWDARSRLGVFAGYQN